MTDVRTARWTIAAARLVILVSFLDLFVQFPVVGPYAASLGASGTMVGVVVAVYSAANMVGNLGAGVLIDRWGRKMPVLIGLILTAVAVLAYALVETPGQLIAARLVHGLAAASLTPGAFALIGDAASADRRARVMGISGAIIAVVAMIGPPLGGITRDRLGFEAVFVGAAIVMLIAAVVFAAMAREQVAVARVAERTTAAGYLALWLRPSLVTTYLAALALTIGLGTLVTHLPITMAARGESSSGTGFAFTVYAVVGLIVMASPMNRLSDRYGRYGPLGVGLLLIGIGMALLGFVEGRTGIALGMGVFGFGFGLLFPAATALLTEATEPAERGSAFGIFYAVYSLGVVIGSLLSGVLDDWLGALSAAPFLVGAAVAIVAAPAVLLWRRGARLALVDG